MKRFLATVLFGLFLARSLDATGILNTIYYLAIEFKAI